METKEYFEKVMQDYNQHRRGRSLRKYCSDEGIDYNWLIEYKKNYPGVKKPQETSAPSLIPLTVEEKNVPTGWQVSQLVLSSPEGDTIEIKCSNLVVVVDLLQKLS